MNEVFDLLKRRNQYSIYKKSTSDKPTTSNSGRRRIDPRDATWLG